MEEPQTQFIDIILPFEQSEAEDAWRAAIAEKLGIDVETIVEMRLRKHSVDARARQIKVQLRLEYSVDGPLPPEPEIKIELAKVSNDDLPIIIVGTGPAGMFAALRCLENGRRPILLERGKDASSRRFDLAPILRKGTVVEDSNYCFGEGGAGTFSDGKLYTRATKRGPVRQVYETFVAHGAPPRILVDAHPHIGSNLLPKVVMAMRQTILNAGGEVHFGAKVTKLLRSPDGKILRGVATANGREFVGSGVILATGHNARDIYKLLAENKILLEAKPFAVGVRIEHPQPLIDSLQYHIPRESERPHLLPAARYSLATKIRNRGVHSFCMCPGGFIVPAATENDEVVVNGMSLARRDSPFANSGFVVTVEPEDTAFLKNEHGILSGIAFQRKLELRASKAGGGMQKAPAQRVTDYLARRESADLPDTSYFPGTTSVRLDEILPRFIAGRIAEGLKQFGKSMRGYITEEALLLGFETRTSSPLRIPRSHTTFQHPEVEGLFPCGEGAGFAGGIVSAALDGYRSADAACKQ
jgi:uncharacterized FAD-dependent dehydrogenase|tara:strand:+ start:13037 stop:14620 length:1584 start_codon:yes stop_codon:yes gene_type:complete